MSNSLLHVFRTLPLHRLLLVGGGVLVLLFVFIKPESSVGLSWFERLLFWSCHITIGLIGIKLASILMARLFVGHFSIWLKLLFSGVLATIIVSPSYLVLEAFFPGLLSHQPDSWLDHFAEKSAGQAVIAEIIEVMPVFLMTWLAINLPFLLQIKPTQGPLEQKANLPPNEAIKLKSVNRDTMLCEQTDKLKNALDDSSFIANLPDNIGRDVISISSDLHYLIVITTKGNATVLGSLAQVAQELSELGMLVHRSHWIAHAHVRKLHIAGNTAYCLLSNEEKIPVSRRKRKDAKARYGANVVQLADIRKIS